MGDFNFTKAQQFELDFHKQYVSKVFQKDYDKLMSDKAKNPVDLDPAVLSSMWEDNFFNGNLEDVKKFISHIKGKNCMDVGCGCIPWTKDTWTVKHVDMVDPLVDKYKELEVGMFGKSFFDGDNVSIYPQGAETLIDSLVNTVDGYIFCRNTIDHSEDPMSILYNLSQYATSGCYLLFWSDIWHNNGGDTGHHSITRSKDAIDCLLRGLGFSSIK